MEMIEVEAFVAVAEAGSFTRAATALYLSQPAVSRRIELLEREVGAPLFDRVRGGVRLTAAGEAFLPPARRVLAAATDAITAARATERGDEGTIRLAMVGTLASSDLVGRLRSFRAAFPGVRLALRTAKSDEVSALVAQGEVTLGVRYFPDPSPGIVSELVTEEELIVVGSGHNDGVAGPVDGMPWVAFPMGAGSSGEPFTRVLERQLARAGLDGAELVAIDSLTAQKRLIEAGFGVGLLPVSAVEEELRLGTLRRLTIAGMMAMVPVMAIRRREGYLGPAGERLLAALTGRARGDDVGTMLPPDPSKETGAKQLI